MMVNIMYGPYAKSDPVETLFEHTQNVVNNVYDIKSQYDYRISHIINCEFRKYFWDALILSCKAHDLGKIQSSFQYRICKVINKHSEKNNSKLLLDHINILKVKTQNITEIPHNIISPAFLSIGVESFPSNIKRVIYQAIAYHHNRGNEYVKDNMWGEIQKTIDEDVAKNITQIGTMKSFFDYELEPNAFYRKKLIPRIMKKDNEFMFYVLLKGFLHRADHAASAGIPVEIQSKTYNSESVKKYMINKQIAIEKIWQIDEAKKCRDDSVILQAGTGSGKTEFALFWLNGKKGFYTLPIKTSVNSMYDRLIETYSMDLKKPEIGLLHSDSMFYLMDKKDDDNMVDPLQTANESRHLSMPLSVSTADQIFTAVLKYPGYEKIYATLACSKLIIDEIQAYNPEIIALILKGLVELHKLGCMFCIITATLPPLCTEYLRSKDIKIKELAPKFRDDPRHRIKMIEGHISSHEIIEIIKKRKKNTSKILIIVNTVKESIVIKKLLDENGIDSNLLHSRFTLKDRRKKEKAIKTNVKDIWITTQLVEASIDIDFDVLITEISTIDSQIQRWGRIWRRQDDRGKYKSELPNIYITKEPSDNGKIYDKEITELSIIEIEKKNSIISDKDEYQMVQYVFKTSNLEDTEYKRKFDQWIRIFDNLETPANSKKMAQKIFRDINDVSVIPTVVYEQNKIEINSALENLSFTGKENSTRRLYALKTIKENSVSIPYWYYDKNKNKLYDLDEKYKIERLDVDYSFDFGVQLGNNEIGYSNMNDGKKNSPVENKK